MTLGQEFQDHLKTLEHERLRVRRDYQGAELIAWLVVVAALLLALSAPFLGVPVAGEILFSVVILFFVSAPWREGKEEVFRRLFRNQITRAWFRKSVPDAYLVDLKASDVRREDRLNFERSILRSRSLPIYVEPSVEERVMFDRDLYRTTLYIVDCAIAPALISKLVGRRTSAFRAVVWHQPRRTSEPRTLVAKDKSWARERGLGLIASIFISLTLIRVFVILAEAFRGANSPSRYGFWLLVTFASLSFCFAVAALASWFLDRREFRSASLPKVEGFSPEDRTLLASLDLLVDPAADVSVSELSMLAHVYRVTKAASGNRKVAVARNSEGVWLAIRFEKGPFETPLGETLIADKLFESWPEEATLLSSLEIRKALTGLA